MNQAIQTIRTFMNNKGNPIQLVQKMVGNNNPVFNNLLMMAQKGDTQSIETFARNLCKERNVDFDKEFSNFMNNFK